MQTEKEILLNRLKDSLSIDELKKIVSEKDKYKVIYEAAKLLEVKDTIVKSELRDIHYHNIERFYEYIYKNSDLIGDDLDKSYISFYIGDYDNMYLNEDDNRIYLTTDGDGKESHLFYKKGFAPGEKFLIPDIKPVTFTGKNVMYSYYLSSDDYFSHRLIKNVLGRNMKPSDSTSDSCDNSVMNAINGNILIALALKIEKQEEQIKELEKKIL